jgi:arginyl-tRNA synthetase
MTYKEDLKKIKDATIDSFLKAFPAISFKEDSWKECFNISRTHDSKHGDFTSTFAVQIAKSSEIQKSKSNPKIILDKTIEIFNDCYRDILRVDIESVGVYANYKYIDKSTWHDKLKEINVKNDAFGLIKTEKPLKIQIEFVSANPTGPMNVVNARAAAIGDTLSSILKNSGHVITKEYYINDTGVQVHNLALSVEARMKELSGMEFVFPEEGYHGDYIKDVAKEILDKIDTFFWSKSENERLLFIKDLSLTLMTSEQRKQLENYGVVFDVWFSEKSMHNDKALEKTLSVLEERGETYLAEGAKWLKTSNYGDEKDRVLIKEDGDPTYFLADIAYHDNKMKRGFDLIIDILGPDHHGHGIRMKAGLKALGPDAEKLKIFIIQQVNLKRAGVAVKMSKRAGEFVTLQELISEVGKDAARFFFLMRKAESHLDFDIELAKKTTNDNPVYYVQYAHARIASILRKAVENNLDINEFPDMSILENLKLDEEIELIKKLYDFEEVMDKCAENFEPHRMTTYLVDLAGSFHSYYNSNKVISDGDFDLTRARLFLVRGVKVVIRNALTIMGITTPESM